MNNFLIRTRLYLLAAIAVVSLLVIGFSGIYGMTKGSEAVTELGLNRLPSVIGLNEIMRGQVGIKVENRNALLLENDSHAQTKFTEILARRKIVYALMNHGWTTYESVPKIPAEMEHWNTIKKEWAGWQKGNEGLDRLLVALSTNDELAKQRELLRQYAVEIQENAKRSTITQDALNKLIEINARVGNDYYKSSEATLANATRLIHVIGLATLAVVCVFAALIVRSIVTPLTSLQVTMHEISDRNDLTARMQVIGNDEIAQVSNAFNRMMTKVQHSLHEILRSAGEVSAGAERLSSASSQIATSSHGQSESASTMAATVEQISVSISHVSDNATSAANLAHESGQASQDGREIIARTVEEMRDVADSVDRTSGVIASLDEQSNQISAIVNVIKEVADQTNLLALNAAIEAARAGEQGRGFAVVADEVRKLAERTTTSAGEIGEMISKVQATTQEAVTSMRAVVQRVDAGKDLAEQAGSCVQSINEKVEQVAAAINDISFALREQTTASQAMARNVENVAQMSEQNTAASSQSADTAHNLAAVATHMHEAVSRFKV